MKRMVVLIMLLLSLTCGSFAVEIEEIILNENDILDLEDTLEENEIFFRLPAGLDTDDQGNLYYLAGHFVRILKVDIKTFKLVKTISSKGQGPAELSIPVSFCVKKNKIYVYDFGFGGIKIFDTEGKVLQGFKIKFPPSIFNALIKQGIDVASNGEIYVRLIDEKTDTVISIFDQVGNRLRSIIPIGARQNKNFKEWHLNTNFNFLLDKDDNPIVLYRKKGILKKFDPKGNLIWERDLYKYYPKELRKKDKFEVKRSSRSMQVKHTQDFVWICLYDGDDIFVSAYKHGFIYSKSGEPLMKIKKTDGKGFGVLLTWKNSRLYTPTKIYNLKKLGRLP